MAEKWIAGLEPGMPVEEAALVVLSARLAVVEEYLPLAAQSPWRDLEHVHQLRVGTRRADAAFRIFKPALPRKAYREGRDRLRHIRRAAGAARDWDVFLASLEERAQSAPPAEASGLTILSAYALGQRLAAQPALRAVVEGGSLAELAREARGEGHGSFSALARPMIRRRLARLAQAASGDLGDAEVLHRVRIAGKRLRYAMEVCASCYGPAFREELYPQVEEMQEVLGRANDSQVAIRHLTELREAARHHERLWAQARPAAESLLRFHRRRLPQERKRFLAWWTRWQEMDLDSFLA
jgi:CHAD domain-containing protein